MKKVEKISEEKLQEIKEVIGEAFVTNDLFYEFGSLKERRTSVMNYMAVYVDFVIECGALYVNDDETGYIGLCHSKEEPFLPKLKMLFRLLWKVPFKDLRRMMGQIRQNTDGN